MAITEARPSRIRKALAFRPRDCWHNSNVLLTLIERAPRGLTIEQLAARTAWPAETIRQTLNRMVAEDEIGRLPADDGLHRWRYVRVM